MEVRPRHLVTAGLVSILLTMDGMRWRMKADADQKYVRAVLIDGLLPFVPLKDATIIIDNLLPSIWEELEGMPGRLNLYDIKVAYGRVLKRRLLESEGEKR